MPNIVSPRVELIAHTRLTATAHKTASGEYEVTTPIASYMEPSPGAADAETLVEFAGRSCYQSFHRPNPATAKTADYLERTLFDQAHWSIAEHVTATLYFTGVSRAFTHELIRHRHLSYSQLSQRFVDESEANIVVPPALRDGDEHSVNAAAAFAVEAYKDTAQGLIDSGVPRKQSREAARAILPNAIETRIVVTGNLRAWNEVIARRTAPDADAEMIEVMGMARDALAPIAPNIIK